jgi:hypothetical protein
MSPVNSARDWRFAVVISGEELPEGVRLVHPPIPANAKGSLYDSMKRRLLQREGTITGQISLPQYPPLTMVVDRCGDTSSVVQWLRTVDTMKGKIVSARTAAVSVLLTGLDRSCDEQAIARGEDLVVRRKLAVASVVFERIRNAERPLAAILHRGATTLADPSIVMAFTALAQAFFEQFGVEAPDSNEAS